MPLHLLQSLHDMPRLDRVQPENTVLILDECWKALLMASIESFRIATGPLGGTLWI